MRSTIDAHVSLQKCLVYIQAQPNSFQVNPVGYIFTCTSNLSGQYYYKVKDKGREISDTHWNVTQAHMYALVLHKNNCTNISNSLNSF